MPLTTNGLPYPAASDIPDVPRDVQALADAIDPYVKPVWGWAKATASLTIPSGAFTQLSGLSLDAASTGVTLQGNALRCPTSGLYQISAFVTFNYASAGGRSVFVNRNGAILLRTVAAIGANTTSTLVASLVYPLVAGDLITITTYQSSGASLTTDPANNGTSFQLNRL